MKSSAELFGRRSARFKLLALLVGIGIGIAFVVATRGTERLVEGAYVLPGHPLDLVLPTPDTAYVSFAEGTIARLEIPRATGGELRVVTVAGGLRYPRGLALTGDALYVAELGPLPCRPPVPSCKGGDVPGVSVDTTEREILRTSRGRVLAFDLRPDGSLGNGRPIVTNLPVANTDHGLNDLVEGPDERLYLSVGHIDAIYRERRLEPDIDRPRAGLLGTVVSFRKDGSDLRVYARGLRNVYGLAFDDRGQLYGIDNDGPTRQGQQREELMRIERGADYGYPFAPAAASTPRSLYVLRKVGSGGIAWVAGPRRDGTLIFGSCGSLDSIPLARGRDGKARVAPAARLTHLFDVPGCVTSIQPRLGGLLVAAFATRGPSRLFLLPRENAK